MKMKRTLHYLLTALLLITIVLGGALASLRPAAAATGTICDPIGTTTQGNYTIMNNRWGTTATHCINVTSNGFQIIQQDGSSSTSGAPVSYPAIYIGCHYSVCSPSTNLPMQISAINNANTSVTVSYPGSGTYDAAYDIWLNDTTNVSGVQKTEIMIWLNRVGSIQPIGSQVGTTTLAGQSWAVWVGNNGQNNVVSYLASSLGATSFTADLKPFITDTLTRGSFGNTSWYLTSIQMGFEPWSGGVGLAVNSFSASVNAPVPTATATSGGGGGTNVFRVNANGDITVNGTPIRVKGGNWFGLEGRHEPSNDTVNPSGAPMEMYMGNVFWNPTTRTYDSDIAEFKQMGINVIRFPVSPQTLNSTDPQGMAPYLKNKPSEVIANSRLALETILKKLDAAGIYVLLDIHSCSNYIGWRAGRIDARPPWVDATRDNYDFKREDTSCSATGNPAGVTRIQDYNTTKWLADLQTLAGFQTTLGINNILGIDIFNEPWDYTWVDWKTLSEQAYTAINAVNTNTLIFVEGVSDSANNQDGTPATITIEPSGSAPAPNWGGNLFSAGTNIPNIPKNRLVYSPHVYGPSVFVGKQFVDNSVPACVGLSGDAAGDAHCPLIMPSLATMAAGWDSQFGYLKAQGYAIVIGEWGGNMDWPKGAASLRDQTRYSYVTDLTLDKQWQTLFSDYLVSRCIFDSTYWGLNPESGDTGGLYTHLYDPVSNTGGWGTWGPLDSRKMTLVHKLWDVTPGTTCTTGPTATPTKTATGPTPTRTKTATITSTPTITLTTPPSSGLKVQYKAADTNATDNGVKPHFIIVNSGTSSVALSNLKIRYYFSENTTQVFSGNCDYAVLGCGNITTSFASIPPVTGADHYIEIGFTSGAGSLAAGANTGEIQTRFNKADWSNFNEADDYSFDPTKTAFADWTKVTLYNNGVLVWGTPAGGSSATNTPTATATKTSTPTPTPDQNPTITKTPTITLTNPPSSGLKVQYKAADTNATDNGMKPHLIIVNGGTSSVVLSNLKIRYYFTDAGTSFTPNCDYAVLGCSNITASFASISPVTGADHYVEIGFTSGAGSLAAGANTGEIQNRFNKADWSNFNEADDYSFDPTKTAFADWTKVTLYNNGVLVWGTPPGGSGPTNTPTATVTKTATGPTPTFTKTLTITPTPTGPTPTPFTGTPTHVANPFLGATLYVNHDWKGSTTGSTSGVTFNVNTFLWLDSIAAVNGTGAYTHSLNAHIQLARAQGANAMTLVIYDLPNRDCSALSSNGELLIASNGSARYKTEYIDNIYNVLSQYPDMRFIAVIEPDSLPNLITNTSFAKCMEATSPTDGYVANTTYTLNKFYNLRNFYSYLDIGHAGWLGWPNNFNPFVTMVSNMVKGTTHGVNSIDGFVDGTANTQVETETFLDAATMVGGNPVRSGSFFDWNDYIDESHYAAALKTAFQAAGLGAANTNFIIDTSRNGWGGCGGGSGTPARSYALQTCRPTHTSTSTDLETYIDQSRIDRRPAKGDWCNQNGAGIGKLPGPGTAPYLWYVWVKPPGESDGSSVLIPQGPDNPDGKGLDGMCDPTYMGNSLNENMNSNALPNAPLSGAWFQAQFDQLVANKYP